MYNFFTSAQGKVHVLKGWENAEIKDVVTGREVLLPVDPYQDIYTNDLLKCIYFCYWAASFLFGVRRKEFST